MRVIRAYKDLLSHYYSYKKDEKRMFKIWWKKIEKNPKCILDYGQEHEKNFKNLDRYLNKILPFVAKADKKEMLKIFNVYWHLLYLAEPIGDINHTIDEIYSQRITEKLRRVLQKYHKIEKITEYLIKLTTPWKILKTQEEDLAFLKLVQNIQKGRIKDIKDNLKKHLKAYEWIPVWYDNKPWSFHDLQKRLKKELRSRDTNQKIKRIENLAKKNEQECKKIIKMFNLKGRLLQDINSLRHFTFIRTKIDLDTAYIVHKARPIYEKIASLLGLSFDELKFLIPDEIRHGLTGKLGAKELLSKIRPRQKFAVQIFNKDRQKILVGNRARKLVKLIENDIAKQKGAAIVKKEKEVVGIGASQGIARGPARVISSISQLNTMRDGEVLIVPSTSVDFVGAMKKSVAVVTEVGGITCHAAIVSRELGKPCIVNTLVATKVFKNGDLVEVDAEKGIVRKLK